jgi:hypothetical protein
MKCAGCQREAKFFVDTNRQPHCQEHMLEALCSVAVQVIDIEMWEVKQREQRVSKAS